MENYLHTERLKIYREKKTERERKRMKKKEAVYLYIIPAQIIIVLLENITRCHLKRFFIKIDDGKKTFTMNNNKL